MTSKKFVTSIYPDAYAIHSPLGVCIMRNNDEWQLLSKITYDVSWAWEDAAASIRAEMVTILES